MIRLSKVGPGYSQAMLITSLYFWDSTHNTFHLPCGMMTPILFDVAAITGLRPTGETYDPNFMAEDTIGFDGSQATFTNYIADYHKKDIEEVSDVEHISFFSLWLSMCVFYSKSLQIEKKYLPMVNQLHVGYELCLRQIILGCLYEYLGEGVDTLKRFQPRSNFLLSGPYWLLQLWLNATFEASLPNHSPINEDVVEIKNKRVEGTRLTQLTPNDEGFSLHKNFIGYIMMYAKCYHFTYFMAPFANRIYGP